MIRAALLLCFSLFIPRVLLAQQALRAPFEQGVNRSATYSETIAFYQQLARKYPKAFKLQAHGATDSGFPLHLGILSADGTFTPEKAENGEKCVLFINNAIHPGEPDGVDASMLLLRDLLSDPARLRALDQVVVLVVPFYNIGGGLNRTSFSRANQNGPEAYGFRGNARNLDLNRDFIKCDSRNAQTFNQLYARWRPHVFVDTHVSNGADYPYTMTLIATQHNKLEAGLGQFLNARFLPFLYKGMEQAGWEMIPYVNVGRSPEDGISGFLDLPRYSSGYAALHNALSFMPEAHMLKPFPERVKAMRVLLDLFLDFAAKESQAIRQARAKADLAVSTQDSFALNWRPDRTRFDSLLFKGYAAKYKPSEVSGLDRLYYDHAAPWQKNIRYFNYFTPGIKVKKPYAYIIPQAWKEVIDRLQWNGVAMKKLEKDTEIEAEFYYIKKASSPDGPYEGHFLHSQVEVETKILRRTFHRGDYVVIANQPLNRYIVETLEPQGVDAFFAWNLFDSILDQKEYYSSYVFEELASGYLAAHPELKQALEEEKRKNPEMAKSARLQLDFVYRNSPYFEPTLNLYPVGRIGNPVNISGLKIR